MLVWEVVLLEKRGHFTEFGGVSNTNSAFGTYPELGPQVIQSRKTANIGRN